jgi:tRNA threonylcarbamoyladenosine biosynthesis protein TsaE
MRLRSTDPDATGLLGRELGAALVAGDVVALTGPLGAGKTRLVRGLAEGLEVTGRITSPTFVLVHRHPGRIPLVHVDAYRLERAVDLLTLDDDVLDETVVTCVEWGELVRDALPPARLDVELAIDGDHGDAPRIITLSASDAAWSERLVVLGERCEALAAQHDALTVIDR